MSSGQDATSALSRYLVPLPVAPQSNMPLDVYHTVCRSTAVPKISTRLPSRAGVKGTLNPKRDELFAFFTDKIQPAKHVMYTYQAYFEIAIKLLGHVCCRSCSLATTSACPGVLDEIAAIFFFAHHDDGFGSAGTLLYEAWVRCGTTRRTGNIS